jgi:prepilin peptidase CpaA
LWLGFDHLPTFLTYTAALGGVLALGVLAYRSAPVGALPLPGWAARLHTKGEGMPYGVAIAAGAFVIYPATLWYAAFTG